MLLPPVQQFSFENVIFSPIKLPKKRKLFFLLHEAQGKNQHLENQFFPLEMEVS